MYADVFTLVTNSFLMVIVEKIIFVDFLGFVVQFCVCTVRFDSDGRSVLLWFELLFFLKDKRGKMMKKIANLFNSSKAFQVFRVLKF